MIQKERRGLTSTKKKNSTKQIVHTTRILNFHPTFLYPRILISRKRGKKKRQQQDGERGAPGHAHGRAAQRGGGRALGRRFGEAETGKIPFKKTWEILDMESSFQQSGSGLFGLKKVGPSSGRARASPTFHIEKDRKNRARAESG